MESPPTGFLDFQVNPHDLESARVVETERQPLITGQVRFRVDHFALTANNITYASAGSFLGYLDFFPVVQAEDEPWRHIPVMGHGEIIESAHPDIAAGGRYFGFFPMAGEHVLTAERRGSGIWDAGAHREGHAPAYRQFEDVRADPFYTPAREHHVALLRGLYITSFLVDDFLADSGDFGADVVLVTSASSKTSIALGHCLRERRKPSIALTSDRNLASVAGLGIYDRVVTYDEVEMLDAQPAVVVDMAGNAEVLAAIHERFGDGLGYSCIVGATHRDHLGGTTEMPGPTPEFFFAPSQIQKRSEDWGPGEVMRRAGEGFQRFVEFADTWLDIRVGSGATAARDAYLEVLRGQSEPTTGIILSLASPVP